MIDRRAATAAAEAFAVGASIDAVDAHPTGHINDAFLVTAGRQRFLLQRLNAHVFPDADAVMENVVAVTDHLRAKGEPTLTLLTTGDSTPSWRDAEGALWRMYRYIDGVHPAEVRCPSDAAIVGHAFGRFHRLTSDLDPARLRVSLPGFHDPARRLAVLDETIADDPHGRVQDAGEEIDALMRLRHLTQRSDAFKALPTRAVHNDAKAANLLVDDTGAQPPVVVDLDTAMPSTLLWDVGDMVRSSTGTADEATAQVRFDEGRYGAILDAWLEEAAAMLTAEERDALPDAGPAATFEQAVRFLTDYLEGDVYFRISRPAQNLERARNQIALLQSMLAVIDA